MAEIKRYPYFYECEQPVTPLILGAGLTPEVGEVPGPEIDIESLLHYEYEGNPPPSRSSDTTPVE